MKRILLLVTLALMLASALALSGVAQARPIIGSKADAKCLAQAAKTVHHPGFRPSNYTFHGGTEANEDFRFFAQADTTTGPDVFCGFGGDDYAPSLAAGDIFLGGAGNDQVDGNRGTFYGGEGDDRVQKFNEGTFNGGAGNDLVIFNDSGGTFNGGAGNDRVSEQHGTFNGGKGDDEVDFNHGTFNGGAGNDTATFNFPEGTFNGGAGNDSVLVLNEGTTNSVENGV
jgi:hypothetical protein